MWCSVWFKNGPISPSRILWFPLEQSWLLGALFGLEGDCTCCFRKHDGMKYDKPVVRLMLGLYAEVLKFEGGCTSSFKSGSTCCTRILPFQLDLDLGLDFDFGFGFDLILAGFRLDLDSDSVLAACIGL